MASLFGLSKGIVYLNKRMGSKPSEMDFRGSFQIIDYVICVLLSQGYKFIEVYLTIIWTHQILKITWRYFNVVLLCNWQGAYCGKRQLAIRFAAAAWCLACFVLVQVYSSTLIAFITSPNNKPIINSVYDIEKVPGLKITVNRNFAADLRLLVSYLPLLWYFFYWVTFLNVQYSLSPRV
jgi:hypothetical protein